MGCATERKSYRRVRTEPCGMYIFIEEPDSDKESCWSQASASQGHGRYPFGVYIMYMYNLFCSSFSKPYLAYSSKSECHVSASSLISRDARPQLDMLTPLPFMQNQRPSRPLISVVCDSSILPVMPFPSSCPFSSLRRRLSRCRPRRRRPGSP